MKIVITGGSGFIGSHLVEYFQDKAEVVVLDNLRTGHRENLAGLKCNFVNESVLNRDAVAACCHGADYIIHLAALVSVPESIERPQECNDINLAGLLNVLEAARKYQVKKVILASSAAIYGPSPIVPKTESMLPEPISPYAVTKLAGEHFLNMYTAQYGLKTVSLRYFNVFGPRQDPHGAYAAAVPIFIKKALDNDPLVIYGDGKQVRDFVYVKDVVRANELALKDDFPCGSYNVAGGLTITIGELAKKIIGLASSHSIIQYQTTRAGDLMISQAAINKIKSCGFTPLFSLDKGLSETIAAMRS